MEVVQRLLRVLNIPRQFPHNRVQIDCGVVLRRLRARVADQAAVVEGLHGLHTFGRTYLQLARYELLRLYGIERDRTPPVRLARFNFGHLKLVKAVAAIEDRVTLILRGYASFRPGEINELLLFAIRESRYLELEVPKLFWLEVVYLILPLDEEAEGRELARPVTQHHLAMGTHDMPEAQRLESSEARTHSEVDLLAHPDGITQVLVWLLQFLHSACNVLSCEGREACAKDLQARLLLFHQCILYLFNDIKRYRFAFSVAVEPQNELVDILGAILKVADDFDALWNRLLNHICLKELTNR